MFFIVSVFLLWCFLFVDCLLCHSTLFHVVVFYSLFTSLLFSYLFCLFLSFFASLPSPPLSSPPPFPSLPFPSLPFPSLPCSLSFFLSVLSFLPSFLLSSFTFSFIPIFLSGVEKASAGSSKCKCGVAGSRSCLHCQLASNSQICLIAF